MQVELWVLILTIMVVFPLGGLAAFLVITRLSSRSRPARAPRQPSKLALAKSPGRGPRQDHRACRPRRPPPIAARPWTEPGRHPGRNQGLPGPRGEARRDPGPQPGADRPARTAPGGPRAAPGAGGRPREELQRNLQSDRDALRTQLQRISGLTPEQARQEYLAEVRRQSEHEGAALAQQVVEAAERDARTRAREITLQAIQRYASENVSETTIRTIKIPSEEVKGRIIGREGRNIRAIERATGADILVDDTPGVISVSCFDKVRQAIAAEALQRLVADGRIHPTRIEELVEQTKRDINERIQKEGQAAVLETNLRGLHPKIVEAMGKLSFRSSYGQNVLRHSVEVAFLAQIMADELGLDGQIARRAGFLHDIGKAMDHEMEGGHPAIGMEFLRRHGEKSEAVLNAAGGHHADIPATTPYTPIVMAADAVSGARPGARRESLEMYVKRLEQLEGIAREQPFVEEAYAIQAGREVRVIVDAKKADDAYAFKIAQDIAKKVEAEMTFPGEIKVTVLREVRAEATAR
ncbi:MAG: ribonuclease Y [Phycisphaerales bacterium]